MYVHSSQWVKEKREGGREGGRKVCEEIIE